MANITFQITTLVLMIPYIYACSQLQVSSFKDGLDYLDGDYNITDTNCSDRAVYQFQNHSLFYVNDPLKWRIQIASPNCSSHGADTMFDSDAYEVPLGRWLHDIIVSCKDSSSSSAQMIAGQIPILLLGFFEWRLLLN